MYWTLRNAGGVVTQNAWVNSPFVITIALSIYLGLFCLRRCQQGDLPDMVAEGSALQAGVLGLAAFLPFDFEPLMRLEEVPPQHRHLLILIGMVKLLAWWYLLGSVVSYYVLGSERTLALMAFIFPSVRQEQKEDSHRTELKQPSSTDQSDE